MEFIGRLDEDLGKPTFAFRDSIRPSRISALRYGVLKILIIIK